MMGGYWLRLITGMKSHQETIKLFEWKYLSEFLFIFKRNEEHQYSYKYIQEWFGKEIWMSNKNNQWAGKDLVS